jgi:arsenate reductase
VTITIYHNPDCGTSRNVLAVIRSSGAEPRIVDYLKTPPSRDELIELLRRMGMRPRELLRRKGTPYDQLGLDDAKWTDDQLIDLMLQNPILMNRPVVVTELGVKLCRPSGTVLAILPNREKGPFGEEDGTPVT